MHTLAADGLPKLLLQHIINTVQNKIHHLHRRIHNAQLLGHLRKGIAKKLIV